MKVLLIEDDEDVAIPFLLEGMANLRPPVDSVLAKSRDSALHLLNELLFDLVICDLHIPTQDGALDHHVDHGSLVQSYVVDRLPGTPIIVISGYASRDFLEELIQVGNQQDVFGNNQPIPMVLYLQKGKLDKCLERISEFSAELRTLEDIAIVGPYSNAARQDEIRVLRVFARRRDGIIVEAKKLPGGLSGSRTLKVDVRDRRNMLRARSVAKIGDLSNLLDERERYRLVSPLLPPGSVVLEHDIVEAGMGKTGGLFYQRDRGFEKTLSDVLIEDPSQAVDVVMRLREIMTRWIDEAVYDGFTVGEVRSWFLRDDAVLENALHRIDWETFESRSLQCRIGHQHGDLHAGNILVDEHGNLTCPHYLVHFLC